MIGDANLAAARLEAANKEHRELLIKQESLMVENTLSGSTSAGVKSLSEDEKNVLEAKKFLKGTGFEDILD